MQRRQVIQFGLVGGMLPSALTLAGVPAAGQFPASVRWWQARDARIAPLARPGDWLAVDTATVQHDGDGLYLYPAWGEPRPYRVHAVGRGASVLEFRDPASGRLLWSDSRGVRFAGRVCACVPGNAAALVGDLPLLQLPRLPV